MANRRIEYVFGPPRPSTGHSLGISAVTLSTDICLLPNSYGTLFSGGRDGRINAWGLSPTSGPQQGIHSARVSDIHTNWVCDVQLFSRDSIVSSSADTTVKLWNVEQDNITTIGHHTDYAQCVAKLTDDTVVSGGLDDRLIGWNVNRPGGAAAFDINTGHSVYAVAPAPPHVVACASSDGAIRIWDTRQSHYIAKYTGHTDCVRSLFVTNGDTLVSGSSDGTVRVWSMRTGRVFKTLNHFRSSVWSLQPHGNGFLAGDREGNIYRSDRLDEEPHIVMEHSILEGGLKGIAADPVTSNIWVASPFTPDLRCINPQLGNEVLKLKGHRGLRKHRLINDKRRALVVDTDGDVGMVDLISAKQLDFVRHIDLSNHQNLDAKLDEILDEINTMDVLDNWCQVQTKAGQICVTLDHRSINNTEVYLDDLIEHVSHTRKTPCPTPTQSPRATPVASPISTPVGSGFFRQSRSPFVSPAVSRVTSTQSMSEIVRQEQQRQRNRLGTGQGHAKFYDPDDEGDEDEPQEEHQAANARKHSAHANSVDGSSRASTTERTASGSGNPNSSAQSSTKAGHSNPSTNDEGGESEEPADSETADDEIRINLGNFVLENLLRGVISRLKKEYEELPEPPKLSKNSHHDADDRSSNATSETAHNALSMFSLNDNKPDRKRTRFFSKLLGIGRKKDEDQQSNRSASGGGGNQQSSGSSKSANGSAGGASASNASSSSPSTTTGNPESPQQIKQKIQQQHKNEPDSATFLEAWSRAVANRSLESPDPESPETDVLSRHARLVVTEIAPGAGAPTEIFSTTVGKLIHNKQEDEKIEKVLPGWVGDAVLLGKLNLKQHTKIGFSVSPEEPDMPELTPESTRLMAISMLRARKIMAYTVGQLQQQKILSPQASDYPPDELVTLTCQGTEITPHTTLATIRTRIWRKGGDVAMNYKLKQRV